MKWIKLIVMVIFLVGFIVPLIVKDGEGRRADPLTAAGIGFALASLACITMAMGLVLYLVFVKI